MIKIVTLSPSGSILKYYQGEVSNEKKKKWVGNDKDAKNLPWQRKPWCNRPLRYLWHFSHLSKTLKLWGTRLWALLVVLVVVDVVLTLLLLLPVPPVSLTDNVTYEVSEPARVEGDEGWQSSSMHTNIFFWWNSSFIPMFWKIKNKISLKNLSQLSKIKKKKLSQLSKKKKELFQLPKNRNKNYLNHQKEKKWIISILKKKVKISIFQ